MDDIAVLLYCRVAALSGMLQELSIPGEPDVFLTINDRDESE